MLKCTIPTASYQHFEGLTEPHQFIEDSDEDRTLSVEDDSSVSSFDEEQAEKTQRRVNKSEKKTSLRKDDALEVKRKSSNTLSRDAEEDYTRVKPVSKIRVAPMSDLAELDDKEGRWNKHYKLVRKKMGNLEPSEYFGDLSTPVEIFPCST